MPTVDEISAEIWGPNSSFVVPIGDPKYADTKLTDGRPAIAPITALRWAVESAQALRSEVAALRTEVAALHTATPITSPSGIPDITAIARAVVDELARRVQN